MFKKIINRVKNFLCYIKKYKDREDFILSSSKNLFTKNKQCQIYEKMEKQFAHIIEKGVDELPAVKSNKVWILWLQGEENAPDIVKACIKSIRENLKDKEIIVLSENNLHNYIELPEYIEKKYKEGIIGNAHYSDLIRIELLCKWGGVWLDSTVLCTSGNLPISIIKAPLFVFQEIDLALGKDNPIISSNWCIFADSNQKILLLTKKLLFEYWKTANKAENYFIFHIFFAISARRYPKDWKAVPVFNNQSPHTLQFELFDKYTDYRWEEIKGMSFLHKLNHHHNYSKCKNCFYNKIIIEYK